MPGQLFTTYFLEEGILHTEAWQQSLSAPSDLDAFRAHALTFLDNAAAFHTINEASTEQELIRPLLELLAGATTCPSRAATATKTSPTSCCSATPSRKRTPP